MQIGARTTGGITKVVIVSGGTGYTAPPTVTFSPANGAVGYAHLAGTAVDSIVMHAAGTGFTTSPTVTLSGGGGSGAAATAAVFTGTLRPLSFFKGRYGDVYGVDGGGRGFRWDGAASSVTPIGLAKPAVGPAMTASTTNSGDFIKAIHVIEGGNGYSSEPTVVLTGGTPTRPASARAVMEFGRVIGVTVNEPGAGYQAVPAVSFTGGQGTSAALSVGVVGGVYALTLVNGGTGYTSATTASPLTLVFSTAQGLTNANARLYVDQDGKLEPPLLLSGGTGATTTGVTAAVSGGGGTGAVVAVGMQFSVASVTAAHTGAGYHSAPVITIRPAKEDFGGSGAIVESYVNTAGNLTGATVHAGGQYSLPPSAVILDTGAVAHAEIGRPMRGTYRCAVRYIDDTPPAKGGPIASSISHLAEITVAAGAGSLTWTMSHSGRDSRASKLELWRTTADQSVILFRVATLDATATSYVDTLSDDDLKDPDRSGYALMPVTLPSGQINSRRFELPPGECAVACMFQDRAWYAVDTSGDKPNSLFYSEVDEPESVPAANELVVQENTGEPDKVVALVPLGSMLLIAQQQHLYKLAYVAQPVIDASIVLVGYRGVLSTRCWDVMGGVAFLVDSNGLYAFDGNSEDALSVAVDNYWRDGVIDFSQSDKFHVRTDFASRTVRFYYCQAGETEPARALCYCVATKAWWEEQYPQPITATCPVILGGQRTPVSATSAGDFLKPAGTTDRGTAIQYQIRTGPLRLKNERGSRAVGVLYSPTASESVLHLSLHYNNSPTPRANAVASDRADGFTSVAGGTAVQLNMAGSRSALGSANGYARASFSGRVDENSAGGDRHVAVALAGTQAGTNSVVVHGVVIEGAE